MSMNPLGNPDTRGFTMVEVLVTMVIICFGMLGLAGLILKGHQASSEAYDRNQALILANDIAEKMRANRLANGQLNSAPYTAFAPVGGTTGAAFIPLTLDCSAANCTPAQVATYDLQTWNNLLFGAQETSTATANANVGGIANARGCIEASGVAGTGQVRVNVAWQGVMQTVTPPAGLNCGFGVYTPDTSRRLVYIDVQ
jgi:type IV pilus assembly protein PilV